MAKRVRSRSSHRPGGQGPSRTKKTSDDSTSAAEGASQTTTDNDVDSAIEATGAEYTEVAIDPATTPAPATTSRRRSRRRGAKARPDDLAARAAAENVWVREDLRRIGIVSAILLVALALAWVVFVAMDVLNLY